MACHRKKHNKFCRHPGKGLHQNKKRAHVKIDLVVGDFGKSDNPRANAFEGTVFVSHPELFFSFGFHNYGQLAIIIMSLNPQFLKVNKKF